MDDVNSAARAAANAGNGVRDRFVTDLQTLSTHAQELLHATQTVSGDGIAVAREKLTHSIKAAGDHFSRMKNDALDQGRQVAAQADSYVRENPWQATAAGVVAGIALGLAMSSMARGSSARR